MNERNESEYMSENERGVKKEKKAWGVVFVLFTPPTLFFFLIYVSMLSEFFQVPLL